MEGKKELKSRTEEMFDSCVETARSALLNAKAPVSAEIHIFLDMNCIPEVEYKIKERVCVKESQAKDTFICGDDLEEALFVDVYRKGGVKKVTK